MAVFAQRRHGKTEFLLEDVIPQAEQDNHLCCYINFWEEKDNPVACVVNGVRRSLQPKLGRALMGWKKEMSVNLGILQAKVTQEAQPGVQSANEALDCLLQFKGTILLLCDEVQHLATRRDFDNMSASLRTFIDTNRRRVRTIFTGSSQDNLNRLFRDHRAAFYNSASIVPFPDMGEEFIDFLCKRFVYLSGRRLDLSQVMQVFERQGYSPAYVVELLQVMVRDGIYSVDSGVKYYEQLNPPDQAHRKILSELSALDQNVLKHLITAESEPIYSLSTYTKFTEAVGAKVTQSAVQNSIKRLREQGILVKIGHGKLGFENEQFRNYLMNTLSA